jgi:hypothetical protein
MSAMQLNLIIREIFRIYESVLNLSLEFSDLGYVPGHNVECEDIIEPRLSEHKCLPDQAANYMIYGVNRNIIKEYHMSDSGKCHLINYRTWMNVLTQNGYFSLFKLCLERYRELYGQKPIGKEARLNTVPMLCLDYTLGWIAENYVDTNIEKTVSNQNILMPELLNIVFQYSKHGNPLDTITFRLQNMPTYNCTRWI